MFARVSASTDLQEIMLDSMNCDPACTIKGIHIIMGRAVPVAPLASSAVPRHIRHVRNLGCACDVPDRWIPAGSQCYLYYLISSRRSQGELYGVDK